MHQIKDGVGKGYLAKVNKLNQLSVRSVQFSEELEANLKGDAYNINTGIITLTDANETSILYIKNNESQELVITAVAIGIETSTGGTATEQIVGKFIRNPTTGDIVTNANNAAINGNRNYGSSNSLLVDDYVGASGETKTNGDDHIIAFLGQSGRAFITINEILPRGSSFGINITPQTGNTSMRMYAAIICYLEEVSE